MKTSRARVSESSTSFRLDTCHIEAIFVIMTFRQEIYGVSSGMVARARIRARKLHFHCSPLLEDFGSCLQVLKNFHITVDKTSRI